ncbi:hypothetical protein HDU90_004277 [Geranomyces variabilis]|nr:hypothetical protein HDU90_004277 [Geranomyces variabilis]
MEDIANDLVEDVADDIGATFSSHTINVAKTSVRAKACSKASRSIFQSAQHASRSGIDGFVCSSAKFTPNFYDILRF